MRDNFNIYLVSTIILALIAPFVSSASGLNYVSQFGFNAPWMYGVTHGPSTTFSELTEAARQMNKPLMRFPGGTVSRSYRISQPGYDGTQPGETQNYIIPFSNIFAPIGSEPLVKISFLPNIDLHFKHINYKGSDEELILENLQALSYLLDRGFKVDFVELGNEEYLTPELFWSFGNSPWKPIETIDQNIKALVEIKLTYAWNQSYQNQHFKQGFDKYIALMNMYKSRINALMTARGLPIPKYGIPIPLVASMTYSDVKYWNAYYMKRIRDLRGSDLGKDLLIPHYYFYITNGSSLSAANDLTKVINDLKSYFGINNTATSDPRQFAFTEFSVNEKGSDGVERYDSPVQMAAFSQTASIFGDPNSKTKYFMIHQFFKDGPDHGVISKNSVASSRPVNGVLSGGVMIPNSGYGKNLFYSPRFCLAAKWRGASDAQYSQLKDLYGCN